MAENLCEMRLALAVLSLEAGDHDPDVEAATEDIRTQRETLLEEVLFVDHIIDERLRGDVDEGYPFKGLCWNHFLWDDAKYAQRG